MACWTLSCFRTFLIFTSFLGQNHSKMKFVLVLLALVAVCLAEHAHKLSDKDHFKVGILVIFRLFRKRVAILKKPTRSTKNGTF